MRILFIGDVVARPGREVVTQVLPKVISQEKIDFVIANAENVAHGRGATAQTLSELMQAGVNYFTSGDHIYHHKEFEQDIDSLPVVRPANLPADLGGKRYAIINAGKHGTILLINLLGRVFLNTLSDDPFRTVDAILEETKNSNIDYTLVDFHAEATSEKYALAHYLDGRVTAVVGTHTHTPTSDCMVLPNKTLYVSDIGMTGITNAVLGVKKEIIIDKFLTGLPKKFEWENTGTKAFRSVILDIEQKSIVRYDIDLN